MPATDDSAGRRIPLNWIQWLTLALAFAFCLLVVAGIVALESARNESNKSFRTVLCYFEKRELELGHLSTTQRRQAMRIYAHALALVNEPPCLLEGDAP